MHIRTIGNTAHSRRQVFCIPKMKIHVRAAWIQYNECDLLHGTSAWHEDRQKSRIIVQNPSAFWLRVATTTTDTWKTFVLHDQTLRHWNSPVALPPQIHWIRPVAASITGTYKSPSHIDLDNNRQIKGHGTRIKRNESPIWWFWIMVLMVR